MKSSFVVLTLTSMLFVAKAYSQEICDSDCQQMRQLIEMMKNMGLDKRGAYITNVGPASSVTVPCDPECELIRKIQQKIKGLLGLRQNSADEVHNIIELKKLLKKLQRLRRKQNKKSIKKVKKNRHSDVDQGDHDEHDHDHHYSQEICDSDCQQMRQLIEMLKNMGLDKRGVYVTNVSPASNVTVPCDPECELIRKIQQKIKGLLGLGQNSADEVHNIIELKKLLKKLQRLRRKQNKKSIKKVKTNRQSDEDQGDHDEHDHDHHNEDHQDHHRRRRNANECDETCRFKKLKERLQKLRL